MTYSISGLPLQDFQPLFGLPPPSWPAATSCA
jgi:hypothetical protein